MFVTLAKYKRLQNIAAEELARVMIERNNWFHRYKAQVRIGQELRGRIDAGAAPNHGLTVPQFTDDDLRKLLMLVHPDKHGGKQQAIDMTAKINALRNS